MTASEFDVLVLGAGPAGYVGAIRAAQLGASVAIVEKDNWGGTCLNRGCIPSKALIHAAEALQLAREGKSFGVIFGEPQIDWDGVRKFKSRAVKQLTSGVATLLKANKVTMFVGDARFVGEREVQVAGADGSTQTLRAKNVLIATGSTPFVPPIPGIDSPNVYTSDQMVDLPGPFESLAIVGAGAIG